MQLPYINEYQKKEGTAMDKETAAHRSAGTHEEALHKLRRFNFIMGILHLLQGIFMWVVSNDKTYPIFTNYLSFDRAIFTLKPNPQLLYQVRFGPAVSLFLLASAIAHFYLSTIGYEKYR